MYLPDYRAKALLIHLQRIVSHASCSPDDTRTVNALRLARQDMRYISKLLQNEKDKSTITTSKNIRTAP